MRALIVNDDGIDSIGLAVLARVAVDAGLKRSLWPPRTRNVVAPAPRSVRSRRTGPVPSISAASPASPGSGALGVEASPALIAFVAARGAFGDPPDVVLSGINKGPNTGHAILHSGTVGAALTAALNGAGSAAFSLASANAENVDTAEEVARHGVSWIMAEGRPGWVLNINVPDIPPEQLRGLRPATLAGFRAPSRPTSARSPRVM